MNTVDSITATELLETGALDGEAVFQGVSPLVRDLAQELNIPYYEGQIAGRIEEDCSEFWPEDD